MHKSLYKIKGICLFEWLFCIHSADNKGLHFFTCNSLHNFYHHRKLISKIIYYT